PVSFELIVRTIDSTGIANPGAGQAIKLSYRDPQYNEILSETLTTNKFGSISKRLAPEKLTKTGTYQVQVDFPDEHSQTHSFFIDQYRKPEFRIEAQPVKNLYMTGDRVKVKIDTTYYFGAPVKRASLKYTIRSAIDNSRKTALREDNASVERFAYCNYMASDPNPVYLDGQLTTDTNGEAILEFDTKGPVTETLTPSSYGFFDRSFDISLEATDLSRKTVYGDAKAFVGAGDFSLALHCDKSVVKSGDQIKVEIDARRFDKTPVAGSEVTITLGRWKRKNFSNQDYQFEIIKKKTVNTREDGSAAIAFEIADNLITDDYHVIAQSKDSKGRTIADISTVWLFTDKHDSLSAFMNEDHLLSVETDRQSYKPGDTIKAVITLPESNDPAKRLLLVSLEGNKLHEQKLTEVKNGTCLVEFPVSGSCIPTAYVTAAYVGDVHTPLLESKSLEVSPAQNIFALSITPDKNRYRPGDKATLKLKARTTDGKPLANTQLCLSVADESIFAVFDTLRRSGTIYQNVPDIEQSIYRTIENLVLSRFSFTGEHLPEVRHEPVFDGLGFTLLSSIFENRNYGKCDLECKLAAPAAPAPTPEADNLASPEKSKRTSPSSASNQVNSPKLRSNFLDTIAWQPALITDNQGEARLSVKLPDDLTTWRVTANGIDQNNKIASTRFNFISTQDFICNLALPRFYTQSDRSQVTGLIHNLTDSPQTVKVFLATSANIKIHDPLVATLVVKPGEAKRHDWSMEALSQGPASFKLLALGSTASDAVMRSIPVNFFGYRAYFAKSGVERDIDKTIDLPIKLPDDMIKGSQSLDMSFSSSSIGPVLGSFESLIDYPYGCTEQTLSRMIPSLVAGRLHKELNLPIPADAGTRLKVVFEQSLAKLNEYEHD
ncbi:MAG: hypothetical protein K8F91_22985, partial [Candidatus Obscuribacterales bacterium]|nr:hypothetical protein [Candidatus Obscuribacterales bacterium]